MKYNVLSNPVLNFGLGFIIGLSLSSIIFYWSLITNLPHPIFQSIVLIFIFFMLFKNKDKAINHFKLSSFLIGKNWISIAFLGCLLVGSFWFFRYSLDFGGWDAQYIWNAHAKILLENNWIQLFSEENSELVHGDYPLLLPLNLSILWKSIGINPMVTTLFHFSIYLCLIFIMWFASSAHKVEFWISLLLIVLLTFDRHFVAKAASQYADILLGLFLLFSIIFISSKINDFTVLHFTILGFIISSMIWIKNEGIILFGISFLITSWKYRKIKQSFLWLFLGCLPIIITWLHFKLTIAVHNPIFEFENLKLVFNLKRWEILIFQEVSLFFEYYYLLVPILVFVIYQKYCGLIFFYKAALLVVTLSFLSYSLSYLISPYDLVWHIQNSYDRLIVQLYPSLLFVLLIWNNKIVIN